jgi:hypothetical protein
VWIGMRFSGLGMRRGMGWWGRCKAWWMSRIGYGMGVNEVVMRYAHGSRLSSCHLE